MGNENPVTLTNFNAENFIRVFLDIYYDHQVEVLEVRKKEKEKGEAAG